MLYGCSCYHICHCLISARHWVCVRLTSREWPVWQRGLCSFLWQDGGWPHPQQDENVRWSRSCFSWMSSTILSNRGNLFRFFSFHNRTVMDARHVELPRHHISLIINLTESKVAALCTRFRWKRLSSFQHDKLGIYWPQQSLNKQRKTNQRRFSLVQGTHDRFKKKIVTPVCPWRPVGQSLF